MAELLYEAIARERRRLFVGRDAELTAFDAWLCQSPGPTRVFSITGMGGVGKSTLLLRMEEHARAMGFPCVWIDGRACGRTPAGFLAYLDTVHWAEFDPRPGTGSLGTSLARIGPRAVWCIDNYEELEPIDAWLRERFFANLPATGHLIVLASRPRLSENWRNDPGWSVRLVEFLLEPFSRAESKRYLDRAGIAGALADQLVSETGGLPLALSLAVDALRRQPSPSGGLDGEWALSINAKLLREAAGAGVVDLLDVLAVAREADAELIATVLGKRISPDLLAALARLSYVQRSSTGFRLHDVAHRYLLADLRARDFAHLQRLRGRVVQALLHRLESAPTAERASYAWTLLSVCADALPTGGSYANLRATDDLIVRSSRAEDLPVLHRLIGAWERHPFLFDNRESYHCLVDWVVTATPERCRVVCGRSGAILALMVDLLLSSETCARLEAIEPGALRRHLPEEADHLASLSPEMADTHLTVMVGVDEDDEAHAAAELIGVLIRDGLARLSEGTRALVGASHPELQQLLERLGFARYGATIATFGAHESVPWETEYALYQLDLRSGRFGAWVLSFLDTLDDEGPLGSHRARVPITSADLRALLRAWNDPAAWAENPVPAALGMDPDELRATLLKILTGDELPPPLASGDQAILYQTFVRGFSPDVIADHLHISRASYYRHLSRAIDRLRDSLSHD